MCLSVVVNLYVYWRRLQHGRSVGFSRGGSKGIIRSRAISIDGLGMNTGSSKNVPVTQSSVPVVSVPVVAATSLPKKDFYKYRRRDFLSGAEIRLFKVLEMSLDRRFRVFPKVKVADLVSPSCNRFFRMAALLHINQKHIDFVVCDIELVPLCAIELDDRSHDFAQDKDKQKDEIFLSAGLPLVRFRNASFYDPHEVFQKINLAISQKNA